MDVTELGQSCVSKQNKKKTVVQRSLDVDKLSGRVDIVTFYYIGYPTVHSFFLS